MNFIFYALLFILFPFMAQSQIKLEKITPELSNLWGVSVLNKEEVLFTQRAGKLFRLNVFKKEIYEVCREMVKLEDKFLDLVFDMGDIQGLTKKDMHAYNRYIADRRLLQLGLKTNYDQRENPLGWLDEVMGVEHQNFFEGRATSYMKAGLRGRQDKITFTGLES